MTQIVKELTAAEAELEKKLDAIRRTREIFETRDADSPNKTEGSLSPIMTDQLRQLFADGQPRDIKQVMTELRAAHYSGPESRVRGAIRRLMETNELRKRGKAYQIKNKKAA